VCKKKNYDKLKVLRRKISEEVVDGNSSVGRNPLKIPQPTSNIHLEES
jgi:hypothetical protein